MRRFLRRCLLCGSAALAVAACATTNDLSGRSSASQQSNDPASGESTADADGGDGGAARQGPPPTRVSAESLDVGGDSRSYTLSTPKDYSKDKLYPLVLILHGDGGDGPSIRAAIGFEYASWNEAIVAYPQGHGGWNLYDPPAKNDDLAFLVALVDTLKSRLSIDPMRVFGMGFSSGAFMVNQVACRRPSFFRGIVPHSGGAPSEPQDPAATEWSNDFTRCAGQTMGSGPAVRIIHGTADREVTFDSGEFTAAYWAFVDGCQASRSRDVNPPPCLAHDGCPAGRPVEFCAISGLGHAIWSDAGAAAWDFFRSL